MEPLSVFNNQQRQQFQITIDGEIAFLEYRLYEDMIVLMHTEVPEQFGGRGIGSSLATAAFDYAKTHHLKVKVYCPFVVTYLRRHPELDPLIVKPS